MDQRVQKVIDDAVAHDARRRAEAEASRVDRGRVAGFWVRVLADLLDGLVLFAVGALLAIPFRSLFLRMGERGVFVGLAVSLLYTGVLQSRFGDGRTIGKRLLGLRVVRMDGALMSLDRSLVRYALMGGLVYRSAVAYAVTGLLPFLPVTWVDSVLGGAAVALAFGCVLVVPFHPLKRGLHDLLAGTIVIHGAMPDPVFIAGQTKPRQDRGIVIGAAALAVVAIAGSMAVSGSARIERLLDVSKALRNQGVHNVGVSVVDRLEPGGRTVTALASGFIPQPVGGGQPDWAAAQAATIQALRSRFAGGEADQLGAELRTGFNIGIYKSYEIRLLLVDARTGAVSGQTTSHVW
jgi:uncharacterized RDD family membrane protein YckC